MLNSGVVHEDVDCAILLFDSAHFADDGFTIGHVYDRCRSGKSFVFQIPRSRFSPRLTRLRTTCSDRHSSEAISL